MNGYLSKPVDIEKLVAALQQLLPEHCREGGGMTMTDSAGVPQEQVAEDPLDREYHHKNTWRWDVETYCWIVFRIYWRAPR